MGLNLCVGYQAAVRQEAIEALPKPLRHIPWLTETASSLASPLYRQTRTLFSGLNSALVANGAQGHREPILLSPADMFEVQMWGYTGLHRLRRFAAYTAFGHELYDPLEDVDLEDDVVKKYYAQFSAEQPSQLPFQHLMLHGDAEGVYVPQDFEHVIDPGAKLFETVGGGIGSAHRLLAECTALAHLLELPLSLDCDCEELWEAADVPANGSEKWARYGIESFSCLRLIRACERAIATGAALVFC